MDHVAFVLRQWAAERPELDTRAMGVIGRIARLNAAYGQAMHDNVARYGLNMAKFDVLATLRRSGEPYALSPGDLLKATMVASGTMTNRIDRLVQDGLVARIPNPQDNRSVLIGLTEKGRALIDEVVGEHVTTQARLLQGLDEKDQEALTSLLIRAISVLD
jgi:DNA-binding MarR family transcriptional regulator